MCSAAGARGSMALRSSFIVWLRYIAVRLCCQGRVLLRGSTLVLAAMENSSGSPKAFLENGQPPVEKSLWGSRRVFHGREDQGTASEKNAPLTTENWPLARRFFTPCKPNELTF